MSARFVALVAGVFCFFAGSRSRKASCRSSSRRRAPTKVTAVVRTDLGQLKWMVTDATDYTPLQQRGRDVYLREGCWYCHSQFVRPVTGETRRWGPVAESGEFAFDVPHLFGTRRIGPDLMRVGLKYSDEWHLAHFWNPRMLSPDSVMARLSRPVRRARTQRSRSSMTAPATARWRRRRVTEALFDFASKEQIQLTPNADGLLFVPMRARGKAPLILTPNEEFTGDSGADRRRDRGPRGARRLSSRSSA